MQQCSMCAFATNSDERLVTHVVRNHKYDPHFQVHCRAEQCGATYQNWESFKKHLKRKHPDNVPRNEYNVDDPVDDPMENNGVDVGNELNLPDDDNENNVAAGVAGNLPAGALMKWHAAKFLVNIRERKRISQRALDYMIAGTDDLMKIKLNELLEKCTASADPETNLLPMERITNLIQEVSTSLFKGVSTDYLLKKYLRTESGLREPTRIVVGRGTKWSKSNPPRVIEYEAHAYVVPFMASLEELLNNDQVMNCIENPLVNDTEFIRNFTDGQYFKTKVFFLEAPKLFIVFYYDDVCLTNPLGSKIHKVALFYWTLLNIYPSLRSTLKSINLFAIAKTSYVKKFGVEKIIESFVNDIKLLESEEGYVFHIKGVPRRMHGALLYITADTPAAQFLGGFKEGVGGARLPCRNCMILRTELSSLFSESDKEMRTKADHMRHLEIICDHTLSKQNRQYWSMWYGVNKKSMFCDLQHFDVCGCILQDFMHVVPEGVLICEVRNIIVYCIRNGFVELQAFNNALDRFDYGHLSRDKPSHVEEKHLGTHLHQSAAQSLALGHVLPFILADLVEEPNEELQSMLANLVRLLQIINLCLSYEFLEEDTVLLSHMIKVHHTWFKTLYPEQPITPKFHYMVHFPSQMLNFGPLRHSWCFRFEGFHAYFKSLIPVIRNFKNIEFSLMSRYLKLRWSDVSSLPGEPTPNLLYPGDIIKEGKNSPLDEHPQRDLVLNVLPIQNNGTVIMKSPAVVIHGTKYIAGSVILLECLDYELPKFGQIFEIVVHRDCTVLLYNELVTENFELSINAYKVSKTMDLGSINVNRLIFPHPLSCWSITHKGVYVVLFNHRRIEFMG